MLQITKDNGNQVEWTNDVDSFENPETLAMYLRAAAPEGSYTIDGDNISATPEAIAAAEAELQADIARQEW